VKKTPLWLPVVLLLAMALPGIALAQSYKVEVLVADQGKRERNLGYRLSLASLLRTTLPPDLVPEELLPEVIKKSGDFVQSVRYRRFDASKDIVRLATKKASDAGSAASILVVTYPAALEQILADQVTPDEPAPVPQPIVDERVLALIAVDQQTSRSLLGGNTGVKFQKRLLQLGSANQLEIVFPQLDDTDRQLVSAESILTNQTDKLAAVQQKYATGSRLVGGLFRLSNGAWQSEWRFIDQGLPRDTVNLTTNNLDEALIAVIDQITRPINSGDPADAGLAGAQVVRKGVAVRVENVNSLRDYDRVRQVMLSVDSQAQPESIDPQAVVFRLLQADPYTVGDQLQRTGVLNTVVSQNTAFDRTGNELNFRYVPR